jgi:hypothetical protein
MYEADDDICDLHASVVNVVLNFDALSRSAQDADERIA